MDGKQGVAMAILTLDMMTIQHLDVRVPWNIT